MLLGLDFLKKHGLIIDVKENELHLGDEIIKMSLGNGNDMPTVARDIIADRVVVPPNSVVKTTCKLSRKMTESNIVFEPKAGLELLVPRTIHTSGERPTGCLVNVTDDEVMLKKDQWIGKVVVPEVVYSEIGDK